MPGRFPSILILALAIVGCTQPPPIPTLDRHADTPEIRLLLDDSLSVNDYRAIFKAINKAGKLDTLQDYFEGSSDDELAKLGRALSKHLYETAQDSKGAVALLKRRINDRSFSAMRDRMAKWKASRGAGEEREALFHLASDRAISDHLFAAREFFSAEWRNLARSVRDQADKYEERLEWQSPPSVTAKEWLDDALKFLGSEGQPRFIDLATLSLRLQIGPSLVQALHGLRELEGAQVFEGFGHGLAGLLPQRAGQPNTLHKLLELANEASRPSDGLFLAIEEKFRREPDYIHEFANNFKPLAARSAAGFVREILTTKRPQRGDFYSKAWWESVADRKPNGDPGEGFVELFIAVRTAIERITGPARDEMLAQDAFLHNLPIYTNTFAITRWLEAIVAQNRGSAVWKDEPAEKFHERIFALALKSPKLSLDLTAAAAQGRPSPAQEMEAIGLKDFSQLLQQVLGTGQFGSFVYDFEVAGEPVTFRESLTSAIKKAHDVRPFSDPSSFIRAIIYPLTRPDSPDSLSFQSFETTNMKASMNRVISILSMDAWRKFKKLLFEDLQLVKLDDPQFDTRKLLLNLFDKDAPMKTRVAALFDRIPAIYEFDKPVKGLPSPFETYRAALASTPPARMEPIGNWLALAGSEKWLAEEPDEKPLYPGIRKLVSGGKPVAKAAFGLSALDGFEAHRFFRPAEILVGKDGGGVRRLFGTLLSWLEANRVGIESLLGKALETPELLPVGSGLSDDEIDWVGRFLRDGDQTDLIAYLQSHVGRESALSLVRELQQLTRKGSLREGFRILHELDNDRMHELALVLIEWEKSGELLAFLDALEIWLR